jgi:hypothetical protein
MITRKALAVNIPCMCGKCCRARAVYTKLVLLGWRSHLRGGWINAGVACMFECTFNTRVTIV